MMSKLKGGLIVLMLVLSIMAGASTVLAQNTYTTIWLRVDAFSGSTNLADVPGIVLTITLTGSTLSEPLVWQPTAYDKEADFVVTSGTYTITAQAVGFTTETTTLSLDAVGSPDGKERIIMDLMPTGGSSGGDTTDTDGDGVPDSSDNCPNTANADQTDTDGDGIGDVCDSDPITPEEEGVEIRDVDLPKKVGPGEEFNIEIDVKNTADYEAEDVTVTVVISNIDDGDDLDEESDDFDLDDGDKETVTMSFVVPTDVKEKDYDVDVTVTWYDDNGTKHTSTYDKNIDLDVQKEDHMVSFVEVMLSQTTVEPGEPVELAIDIVNLGDNDENVKFIVDCEELGIDEESAVFELDEGDDTTQYLPLFVDDDAEKGKYYVYVTLVYNDGRSSALESLVLNVKEGSVSVTSSDTTPSGTLTLTPVSTVTTISGQGYQYQGDALDSSVPGINVGLVVSIVALIAVFALVGKEALPLIKKQLKKR